MARCFNLHWKLPVLFPACIVGVEKHYPCASHHLQETLHTGLSCRGSHRFWVLFLVHGGWTVRGWQEQSKNGRNSRGGVVTCGGKDSKRSEVQERRKMGVGGVILCYFAGPAPSVLPERFDQCSLLPCWTSHQTYEASLLLLWWAFKKC